MKNTCSLCNNFGYFKDNRTQDPVCKNGRNFDFKVSAYRDIAVTCPYFKFKVKKNDDLEEVPF